MPVSSLVYDRFKEELFKLFNQERVKEIRVAGKKVTVRGLLEVKDRNIANPFLLLRERVPELILTLVEGDVDISFGNTTNLEGSPRYVDGDFNCSSCRLKSLEGSPEEVGHSFIASENKITSLRGFPKAVGKDVYIDQNLLKDLSNMDGDIEGDLICHSNPGHSSFVKPKGLEGRMI